MLKRHIPLLLVLALVLQLAGTAVFAADSTEDLPAPALSFEEAAANDDPEYYRNMAEEDEDSLQGAFFPNFSPRPLAASESLHRGVDVSEWQQIIDWKAVKNSGIDFAIIRVGYRGYSASGRLAMDDYFVDNINGAIANGIRVGVYIYSQAITPAEAIEEARFVLDRIKGYDIQLPIVIDYEYTDSSSGYTGRLYNANLTKAQGTEICNAFISTVTKAGYRGMVYANKNMLENHLLPDSLQGSLWLAHYASITNYSGYYEFWQCTDKGTVPGINGGADLDFWFENTSDMPFLDVSPNRWSYGSILTAYESGLILGVSDTRFAPAATTTRGQLVTMLYRMNGSPSVTGNSPFTDLTQDYYKSAITWAYQQGIVSGRSATTFAPEDPITRQELVAILYRMKKPGTVSGSLSGYQDASSVSGYAVDAMVWGVSTGLISGYEDSTLRPNNRATREQAATFLVRYMNLP